VTPRIVAQYPLGGGPMMQERPMSLEREQARQQQTGEQHHRDQDAARAAGDVPHLVGQVHRAFPRNARDSTEFQDGLTVC